MKYSAKTDAPETAGKKTVRLVIAALVLLCVLLACSEKITMLTTVLIWLTLGFAAAAVSSMIAILVRRVDPRFSREGIMCLLCGLGAACIAAPTLKRIAEAGCSCEFAAGHSAKYLAIFVPPLTAVALIYLNADLVRHASERRRKASSEPDETASASENTDIR